MWKFDGATERTLYGKREEGESNRSSGVVEAPEMDEATFLEVGARGP
jgi:hypothetical protein